MLFWIETAKVGKDAYICPNLMKMDLRIHISI